MPKAMQSAGLLMYRRRESELEVFLVHPGGPFFAHKDNGFWSIPKGLIENGEGLVAVAAREFAEETGRTVEDCRTSPGFLTLGSVVQRGGKTVTAWAFEGDWPENVGISSNTFRLEWPRGTGRFIEVPEVDEGRFFRLGRARVKINAAQEAFIDRLLAILRGNEAPDS